MKSNAYLTDSVISSALCGRLSELLTPLYGAVKTAAIIEEVAVYVNGFNAQKAASSESACNHQSDVILISYADQLRSKGRSPVAALDDFVAAQVPGLFTAVHLLPFFPYSSDDGFAVMDFKRVNPAVGCWADIQAFASRVDLMFDVVANHMSAKSEWFQRYLDNDPCFKDYFIERDGFEQVEAVVRPRVSPLFSEYTDAEGRRREVWTTFSADQVDLNYRLPAVFLAMLDIVLLYIRRGARLLRLDAIGFLWKEEGTPCIHHENTHRLIKAYRAIIEELAPNVRLVSETNVPHQENVQYFGSGSDEAHMVYNFALPPLVAYALLSHDSTLLSQWAESLAQPTTQAHMFNFTASHDGVGVRAVESILDSDQLTVLLNATTAHGGYVSYKTKGDEVRPYELNCNYLDLLTSPEADDSRRCRRFIAAQAVAMSMPGAVGIYFHSLVGSENDRHGVTRTGSYRAINREQCEFAQITAELADDRTLRAMVFDRMKHLLQVRQSLSALQASAQFKIHHIDVRLFAIERYCQTTGDRVLALINLSEEELVLKGLPLVSECYFDAINKEVLQANAVSCSAYQCRWLLPKVPV